MLICMMYLLGACLAVAAVAATVMIVAVTVEIVTAD
jgi:hypothetical protein